MNRWKEKYFIIDLKKRHFEILSDSESAMSNNYKPYQT